MSFSRLWDVKLTRVKSIAKVCTPPAVIHVETKKAIPLIVAPRRGRFIGAELTKEMGQLHGEDCKLLRKAAK